MILTPTSYVQMDYDGVYPNGKQLFRVLHDWEFLESKHRIKKPEVFTLDDRGMEFTKELQLLSYALFLYGAPSLPVDLRESRHESIFNSGKAFANKFGYDAVNPVRINWITGRNVYNKDAINPHLDKTRICGGATVAGVIEHNYEYRNYLTGKTEIVDFVWIETLDFYNLPTIDELIQTPWLYYHATISYEKKAGMFPNGIVEELGIWNPTLIPLVSKYPVGWPLKYLEPVNDIADPYKFS